MATICDGWQLAAGGFPARSALCSLLAAGLIFRFHRETSSEGAFHSVGAARRLILHSPGQHLLCCLCPAPGPISPELTEPSGKARRAFDIGNRSGDVKKSPRNGGNRR